MKQPNLKDFPLAEETAIKTIQNLENNMRVTENSVNFALSKITKMVWIKMVFALFAKESVFALDAAATI